MITSTIVDVRCAPCRTESVLQVPPDDDMSTSDELRILGATSAEWTRCRRIILAMMIVALVAGLIKQYV